MNAAAALPAWLEALVALLVVVGALAALVGSLGLLRLKTFYERVHPPTMGTTFGAGFILVGSMLLFSALESRPVLHEIVIAVFVVVTTPVTYMLLMRAALHRDRGEAGPRTGEASTAVERDGGGAR